MYISRSCAHPNLFPLPNDQVTPSTRLGNRGDPDLECFSSPLIFPYATLHGHPPYNKVYILESQPRVFQSPSTRATPTHNRSSASWLPVVFLLDTAEHGFVVGPSGVLCMGANAAMAEGSSSSSSSSSSPLLPHRPSSPPPPPPPSSPSSSSFSSSL